MLWKPENALNYSAWGIPAGDPSRTLEENFRKRSRSVSGVFPEFFRNFFRKVPDVVGVWPTQWAFPEGPFSTVAGCPKTAHLV